MGRVGPDLGVVIPRCGVAQRVSRARIAQERCLLVWRAGALGAKKLGEWRPCISSTKDVAEGPVRRGFDARGCPAGQLSLSVEIAAGRGLGFQSENIFLKSVNEAEYPEISLSRSAAWGVALVILARVG